MADETLQRVVRLGKARSRISRMRRFRCRSVGAQLSHVLLSMEDGSQKGDQGIKHGHRPEHEASPREAVMRIDVHL